MIADRPSFQPPAPQPPTTLPTWQLLRAALFNPLNVWCQKHFEEWVVVERTLLGTRLVVSDPAHIKWILVDHADNYVRDSMQQRIVLRMTGRSVFSAEGRKWQVQRQALAPLFSAKTVATYLPNMLAAAEAAVQRLRTIGTEIDLGREMAALTVDVLGRTIFTHGLGEPPTMIAESVRRFADINGMVELGDLLGLPAWLPGMRRMLGWRTTALVERRAKRVIAEAKRAGSSSPDDLFARLFAAQDAETGQSLSTHEIEGNVSTLIGAGSDTVAVALTWSIFLLSQTPHVREAVEAEVDTHLTSEIFTADTLKKLVWTRAVVEESMRLYPPAPMIGRMARSADKLGDEHVPAGASLLISPWVLHRHAKLWHDPHAFMPERFLPEQRAQIPRFAYLPFGAGPRVCLGMGFAMQEAVVILAMLMKHLRFERADHHPIELRQCITLQTKTPLRMHIQSRST
ncbi:MAG: cytochrome P450 [Gallionella sp.]|nr:cytochrome P450 [Gallionella sp.]